MVAALYKHFAFENSTLFLGQLEKVELENGNGKWKWKMEMETEMEKDVENGKGRQSDSIFNATK